MDDVQSILYGLLNEVYLKLFELLKTAREQDNFRSRSKIVDLAADYEIGECAHTVTKQQDTIIL